MAETEGGLELFPHNYLSQYYSYEDEYWKEAGRGRAGCFIDSGKQFRFDELE
jgi:hypothetical protein